jgi:cutinase
MKFQSTAITAFLCAVAATPVLSKPINSAARLQARQTLSDTSNELEDGPCKEVFFIFARGSTESGNMVSL